MMDKGNDCFYGQSLCAKIRCDELAAAKEVKGLCLIFKKKNKEAGLIFFKISLFFPNGKMHLVPLKKAVNSTLNPD